MSEHILDARLVEEPQKAGVEIARLGEERHCRLKLHVRCPCEEAKDLPSDRTSESSINADGDRHTPTKIHAPLRTASSLAAVSSSPTMIRSSRRSAFATVHHRDHERPK
jgi:hypothetical protein